MKFCILMGSPRKNGNTASFLRPFIEELVLLDNEHEYIWLHEKTINPCTSCRTCQKDWKGFGCGIKDDVQSVFKSILDCDVIVLATPIYSWYCTPPMKALLDRLVYGMNKFYGEKNGPCLWAGKRLALIVTCGYPPERGADVFKLGMERYCRHSRLEYLGLLAGRNLGYKHEFMDDEKASMARSFARQINDIVKRSLN